MKIEVLKDFPYTIVWKTKQRDIIRHYANILDMKQDGLLLLLDATSGESFEFYSSGKLLTVKDIE